MNKLTKVCFKCTEEKTLDNFYKHKQMSLGVVNKCKDCNKKDVRLNYKVKAKDISFIEKERERCKEKYSRLNYKEKQKIWDKDKPWKKTSTYKNLNRDLKIPKGFNAHHWNYNNEYLKDIIVIERFEHRRAHEFLVLDLDKKIYKTLDGCYLETKKDHIKYLKQNKIIINE